LITSALMLGPSAPWSAAEQLAILKGTVADSEGGVLPGAKVRIANKATGAVLTVAAGRDGSFSFQDLQPGEYYVEAWDKCFERWADAAVELRPGDLATTDIRLKLCQGSHLDGIKPNFSTRVERVAKADLEERLISRAEVLPCGDRLLRSELISRSAPTCANLDAKKYYFERVNRNEQGELPEAGEGPVVAKAYYQAGAEYDAIEKKWVVKLRLEYSVTCGMLCGETVVRTRWVYFDENENVARVDDEHDCDCHLVS
jgi:hypothetical protein